MSTTFERAPSAIDALVQKALESYHPDLARERVTIDTIIARKTTGGDDDIEDVHALMRSGYPIDAKIQVTSLIDRARGIADAKLTIDGFEWNKATDRQRFALIDHELEHLDLKRHKPTEKDPSDAPLRDDLGRPKLKIRPHDWELMGFQTVALRHAEHSHEAMQFAAFRSNYSQLNLFGPPDLLKIAEGSNGKKERKAKPSKQKVHNLSGNDADKDISSRCASGHHADCKYPKCQCEKCDCAATKKENRANG